MPVSYELDAARGIVRTRCVGNVGLDEVLGHFSTLAQDPACPDRLDVLLDVSEQVNLPDADQLRRVQDEMARVRSRVRFGACAIVASSTALFGMMRMFEILAESQFRTTRVFRAREEAERWLLEQADAPRDAP